MAPILYFTPWVWAQYSTIHLNIELSTLLFSWVLSQYNKTVHFHGDVTFADFAISTKSQKYNVSDQDLDDLNTRKLSWFRSQSSEISCARMGIVGTPRKYHVRENVRSQSTILEYSICRYSNTAAFMVESVKKKH